MIQTLKYAYANGLAKEALSAQARQAPVRTQVNISGPHTGPINVSAPDAATDQSLNINAPVTNSNLAPNAPGALQAINPGIEELLDRILRAGAADETISKSQFLEVKAHLDELRLQLTTPTPSAPALERILNGLGSIASIASLADQVRHFLPRL
jgi:hypothetical protein